MKRNPIKITNKYHVFMAGQTGSGKTTVAEYLLLPAKRLLIVDNKDGIDNDKNLSVDLKDIKSIKRDNDFRFRVVDKDKSIEAIARCYEVGNCIIWFDEITALVEPRKNPPPIIYDVLQRGRSRGVSAFTVTQNPYLMPITMITEAKTFFCFKLNLEKDRKRMSEVMGEQVMRKIVDKYGFWYYDIDEEKPRYFKQLYVV